MYYVYIYMYYVYLFHQYFQNVKYIKEENNNLKCNYILYIIENNWEQ